MSLNPPFRRASLGFDLDLVQAMDKDWGSISCFCEMGFSMSLGSSLDLNGIRYLHIKLLA